MRVPFLLLTLVAAGCEAGDPVSVATCDLLSAPATYEGQRREFQGNVVRLENGDWQFQTYCHPEREGDRPITHPLRWAKGAVIPVRDILDLSPARQPPGVIILTGRDTVAGRLVRDEKGRWTIEATDYFQKHYTI